MSNAEVSAEYCRRAFVARNLAMSASCPDTKAERHAARLVPAESSARNTIETVFCLRRNHISASALNATSQQMTNGRRVLQSGP